MEVKHERVNMLQLIVLDNVITSESARVRFFPLRGADDKFSR
jgi:hypothetical protein